MNRMRLTDAGIRRLKPDARECTVRDSQVSSLCVRVHPSGGRSFAFQSGSWKQSLGPTTLLTVGEARRQCLRLQSEGRDRKARAPVFADFCAGEWRASWIPRCKPATTWYRDRILKTQLLPAFGGIRIDKVTQSDIHQWFDHYSRTSPGGANFALGVLRHIFNHAVRLEYIAASPAKGVRPNPRPKLTRFLSREEIGRLHQCLDRHAAGRRGRQADIIRLLLLTGCRKNEIVRLRRREVDGDRLRLEDSKTGPRTVLLNRRAQEIIEGRLDMTSGEFVFPSPLDPARPVSDSLPLWCEVRREAGIEDVRLHDLRHTYASQAVMQGIPLPVVAKLLGHSQVTMTLRYAHASDKEVEAAAERIGAAISGYLGSPFEH